MKPLAHTPTGTGLYCFAERHLSDSRPGGSLGDYRRKSESDVSTSRGTKCPLFLLFYLCVCIGVLDHLKKHIPHVSKRREIYLTALLETITVSMSTVEDSDVRVNNCVFAVMCLPIEDQCITLQSCFFSVSEAQNMPNIWWAAVTVRPGRGAAIVCLLRSICRSFCCHSGDMMNEGGELTYYHRILHHKEKIKDKV